MPGWGCAVSAGNGKIVAEIAPVLLDDLDDSVQVRRRQAIFDGRVARHPQGIDVRRALGRIIEGDLDFHRFSRNGLRAGLRYFELRLGDGRRFGQHLLGIDANDDRDRWYLYRRFETTALLRQLQLVLDPSPALLGHRLLPLFDDAEPGRISRAKGVATNQRPKQPFDRLELLGGTLVQRQAIEFLLRQVVLVPNSRSKIGILDQVAVAHGADVSGKRNPRFPRLAFAATAFM